jgi:hypothetical protein
LCERVGIQPLLGPLELTGWKIGGIGTIYLDDRTAESEWVTVKTGLFGG